MLVVDDHPVFRRGLCSLLTAAGLQIVGEATSESEAVAMADRTRPDVVIMDIGLPDGSGITATERIVATHPGVRVVVVTLFDDDGSVRAALAAGAAGYVVKDASPDEIVAVVRAAEEGATVLGSGIAPSTGLFDRPNDPAEGLGLTPREHDVAALLQKGLPNRIIAERLGLSGKTVANNVSTILAKLGVADRLEAARQLRG